MRGPGIGGPGPMYVAKSFAVPFVSAELAREWGEALWTARHLADAEFQRRLERTALRGLLLGHL